MDSIILPLALALVRYKHLKGITYSYEFLIVDLIEGLQAAKTKQLTKTKRKTASTATKNNRNIHRFIEYSTKKTSTEFNVSKTDLKKALQSFNIRYDEQDFGGQISFEGARIKHLFQVFKLLLKKEGNRKNRRLLSLFASRIIRTIQREAISSRILCKRLTECQLLPLLHESKYNDFINHKFRCLASIYNSIPDKFAINDYCMSNMFKLVLAKYFNNKLLDVQYPNKTVEHAITSHFDVLVKNKFSENVVKQVEHPDLLDYVMVLNFQQVLATQQNIQLLNALMTYNTNSPLFDVFERVSVQHISDTTQQGGGTDESSHPQSCRF